jgi:hypothetical protein
MSPGSNRDVFASVVARLFFPHTKDLGIEVDASVSPGILKKMVYAGSHGAFEHASADLRELAEITISADRIRRATEKIGNERVKERDQDVQAFEQLTLPAQQQKPASLDPAQVPDVACVEMDGGRLQIRDAAQDISAADKGEEPSNKSSWREDKVGICLSMTSKVQDVDPHPQIPSIFVDPSRMNKLAREIKNAGKKPSKTGGPNDVALQAECEEVNAALSVVEQEKQELRYQAPKIISKDVVATRRDALAFGGMLVMMAWKLGFAAAKRKAFVADGSETNWSVWRRFFSHFTPILDFVHALCYVYQAAMAGRSAEEAWLIYCQWAQWLWSGEVAKVIDALEERLQDLGGSPARDDSTSPQAKVAEALGYCRNQQSRMKYDEYRRQGLPITSSHIESTIKQINRRVKGTEKFWLESGAEALLQLSADYLSDHSELPRFWTQRQLNATGQRHYSIAS